MTKKNRQTTFVNIGITPDVRTLVSTEAARAGALTGRRVPLYQFIAASVAVALKHRDELAAALLDGPDDA